jgi:23S rRNA pseudouridine1911/1915/1917 synthase
MFKKEQILFEDNHVLAVNKAAGQLVQSDTEGESGLEDDIKIFLKNRDNKSGNVFLGVIHRIDRPVSGVVLFAKSSKALARLNEMLKNRDFQKIYWAIVEKRPENMEDTLVHHIVRDGKTNKSRCLSKPTGESKEAKLKYTVVGGSDNYTLLQVALYTGRHHQIRCQLAKIGCPIRGDLKYGAPRSNKDGSISLHSRELEFIHPVTKERIHIIARTDPQDNLWRYFEESQS